EKIVKLDLPCQPCMKRVCPLKHHDCMKQIKADDVLEKASELDGK
ncbi:MAG: ADP-heptose--LPS heptosyltransferase, partial [Campylobacteraceae bacterium]|nr:ADP-heptose--LPS heptosyltransferase [Campylobacteraceae bacterium]